MCLRDHRDATTGRLPTRVGKRSMAPLATCTIITRAEVNERRRTANLKTKMLAPRFNLCTWSGDSTLTTILSGRPSTVLKFHGVGLEHRRIPHTVVLTRGSGKALYSDRYREQGEASTSYCSASPPMRVAFQHGGSIYFRDKAAEVEVFSRHARIQLQWTGGI